MQRYTVDPFLVYDQPKITLVGAGTGDPELITLKGIKAIKSADVILYDALINEQLLTYAQPEAIKVFVGNLTDDNSFSQDAVNKLMVDYALNYGHVVRLKNGDPFVFARGYEEIYFAESYAIQTEVVPGVSSALGVPGLLKIPMVYNGVSESFWVVSGNNAAGALSSDLFAAVSSNATIVVLMGIEKIKEITALFRAEGKNRLPVAAIENGSTSREILAIGIVDTIEELIEEQKIKSPALLVFGNVVALHSDFSALRTFYSMLASQESGE